MWFNDIFIWTTASVYFSSMFPLLGTWFHCHGNEPSMELTYDLIISVTSTAVLVGQDPLTFGKLLRRPDLQPLNTICLHSPFFNF